MEKTKMIFIVLLVIVVMFLVMACATAPVTTSPPAGAVIAEAPKPPIGAKFVYQETNLKSGKVSQIFTWFFEKTAPYERKPAIWARVGLGNYIINPAFAMPEIYWVLDLNYNFLAYLEKGKEIQNASPYIKYFDWPLFIGKKWTARYDFWEKGQRGVVIEDVLVESYEEVKVPVGSFNVFKVKRGGRTMSDTIYYAKELRMMVKRELVIGPEHHKDPGKWVQELIEYNIPEQ